MPFRWRGTISNTFLYNSVHADFGFPFFYSPHLDILEQYVQNVNRTNCSKLSCSMVISVENYKRIRDLREDHDLTQAAVGAAINVPQRTYAYYESGQRMIPPRVLCALADFYHVSVDYLLNRTDNKEPYEK